MPDDLEPADPITDLASAAVHMHELYISYIAAGFEPVAALYLIGCLITGKP